MMEINIYQIDPAKDSNFLAFTGYDGACEKNKSGSVESDIYRLAYTGQTASRDLEEVYEEFNIRKPEDYDGHSMSVSDVVQVLWADEEPSGFYFCDHVGFRKIDFDPEKITESISVVVVEPGKAARVEEIGTGLADLQKVVGGYIETYYPFDEHVCIVCNEEGKLNGMPLNRAIKNADNEIVDIIAGPFFICGCSGENFSSLSLKQQEKYKEMFQKPERFFMAGREIQSVPYEPMVRMEER